MLALLLVDHHSLTAYNCKAEKRPLKVDPELCKQSMCQFREDHIRRLDCRIPCKQICTNGRFGLLPMRFHETTFAQTAVEIYL